MSSLFKSFMIEVSRVEMTTESSVEKLYLSGGITVVCVLASL